MMTFFIGPAEMWRSLPRQLALHRLAHQLAVYPRSAELCHGGLHHVAHVLHGGRAHLGDHCFHCRRDLGFADGLWHIALDKRDLLLFLGRQLRTAALGELLDRILALLDKRAQSRERLLFVEWGALVDL